MNIERINRNILLSNVGKFLRTYRIKHDMTLLVMSKQIGIDQSYLSSIERNKLKINKSFVDKVLSTYDFTKEEIDELTTCYFKDIEKIYLDTTTMTDEQIKLSLLFSRKLSKLSEEEISKINEILSKQPVLDEFIS